LLLLVAALSASRAWAQAEKGTPSPAPDVIIFVNGEKLIGHLVRSTGSRVTFRSDMAREITVPWSNIQELQSSHTFAVIPKNVKLHSRQELNQVPQGAVAMKDQKIDVIPPAGQPPQTVAVPDTAFIVDQAALERVAHPPGFFSNWKGAVTAGVSLVEATQRNRTLTGGITLTRAMPTESWLDHRDRTILNVSAARGTLTQPGSPSLRTSIYHADLERDEYFTQRVYAFGQLAFDHNFSQGLRLQQSYGGGIGWTVLNGPNQSLDVKANLSYGRQRFNDHALNLNLFGSTFAERYTRTLPLGMMLNEQLSVTPAWNNSGAYTAAGSAGLTIPVYKRLSLAVNTIENFLNDPPPGFRKNSLQFTTGLTYSLP
jgi:hypothetical protein